MSAIDLIDEWLDDEKHATLWGRSFDIVQDDSRRHAAEWFKRQVEDFYSFNSGCAVQLRDDEIDVAHLRAEHEAAVAEIEQQRRQINQLRGALALANDKPRERMPYKVDL